MAATKEDLKRWFDSALRQKATHMIVVCDTFDWDDYPVYVLTGEDVREKAKEFDGRNMQKIMEVYSMALPMDDQMAERRAFHWD